jgi:hypothetical protein
VALFAGTASAQIDANRLCINNGGEYYVGGPFYGYPNHGAERYFPKFAHQPGTPFDASAATLKYPWKIAGWGFTGMQANHTDPDWYWDLCLQASKDNPYDARMSFDYPQMYYTGAVPHTGSPAPIYGGALPTSVPVVGGRNYQFPSSAYGFDGYLNIFAVNSGTFNIPSYTAYYGWNFAWTAPCASALTLPSSYSIWMYVFCERGNVTQYCILSGNEMDCTGGKGQKCRNYSIISDTDNGYLWYWQNTCDGVDSEWIMCLFLCDAITVPYNVPPAAQGAFAAYGFDVGIGTLMPLNSSGSHSLGFMSEDFDNAGGARFVLAAFNAPGVAIGPYKKAKYRIAQNWDGLTNIFTGSLIALYLHGITAGYPGCMWGTTAGGNSIALPFPNNPLLHGFEIEYTSMDTKTLEPSATYMTTLF